MKATVRTVVASAVLGAAVLTAAPAHAAAPANDDFSAALVLEGASGTTSGSSVDATAEDGEPEHAGVGHNSVWFSWTAPEDGLATFDTFGSGFDTVLAAYTGDAVNALTPVAANDDTDGLQSQVSFVAEGVSYAIAVSGWGGATGPYVLNWTFEAGAGVPDNDDFANALPLDGVEGTVSGSTVGATTEPDEPHHDGLADAGASVWFSWTAPAEGHAVIDTFGSGFDTVLAVYTGTALDALTPVASNDQAGSNQSRAGFPAAAGTTYAIAVAGWQGDTGAYVLNWVLGEPLANDDFADARLLDGAVGEVAGSNVGATMEPGEPTHTGNAAASVWYRWTSPVDGGARFETVGSTFDTVLAIYTGEAVDDLTLVTENDDIQFPDIPQSRVTFRAARDQTYFIAVGGWPGSEGDIALTWRSADSAPNDFFVDAELLEGPSGSVTGSNVGAIDEWPDEPSHHRGEEASVWYRWTAPDDDAFAFDSFGSNFDTVIAVYTGETLDSLAPVAVNDDSGGLQSRIAFSAQTGATYSIALASGLSDTGDIVLSWAPVDPATRPPNDDFADAEVLEGDAGTTSGSNVGATREAGEPGTPTVEAESVWYSWTAPVDGVMTIDTAGSDFDAELAVYTGESVDSLTRVLAPSGIFDAAGSTTYHIAVTGFFDTGAIILNWAFHAAPANDDFAAAQILSGPGGSVDGSNAGATLEAGEPDHYHSFHGARASAWYRWTAPGDGLASFEVVDATFRSVIAVYTGTALDDLDVVASDADGSEELTEVTFPVEAGGSYHVAVAGTASGERGEFALVWERYEAAANDSVADATDIPAAGSLTATNVDATVEPAEPLHLGTGGASVWYRWTAPGDGPVTFETNGSRFDTVVAVYTGSSVDDLELVAQNDDADVFDDWSQLRFDAIGGTTYLVAVDGTFGAQGVFDLNWYPAPANDDFAGRESISGATGTLAGTSRGAATEPGEPDGGSGTVWYRWVAPDDAPVLFTVTGSDNHIIVAAYTGSSLGTLTEGARARSFQGSERAAGMRIDAVGGVEYAIAVGASGSFEPRFGAFTLSWNGPLAGDDFAEAIEIDGTDATIEHTTVGATREQGEPLHARGEGPSVWYRWTAPADGGVTVDTLETRNFFDTTLAVYTGDAVDSLVGVTVNDDDPLSCCDMHSRARFTAAAGETYYIAVAGDTSTSFGPFVLRLRLDPPPANDDFTDALLISSQQGRVTGTTIGATEEPGEPHHAGEGEASVWYRWTAPADGAAAFDTVGSDFDTVLAVYTGSSVDTLTPVATNTDINFQRAEIRSRVSFPVTAGTTYHVAVSGRRLFGGMGGVTLNWAPTTAAPHDDFINAQTISAASGTVEARTDAATTEPGEPLHAGVATASVWYSWTAPATGPMSFVVPSGFDAAIGVYTGEAVDDLTLVAENDDNRTGIPEVNFVATEGTTYVLAIGGAGGATGAITLRWEPIDPPANDNFDAATLVEGSSGTISGTNKAATRELSESTHAGSGGSSVWYAWTAPATGRFVFDTYESRFDLDTLLAVYTGESVGDLSLIAENDDAPGTAKSAVELDASAGTTYHIAVDGFGGATGPIVLRWSDTPANDDFDQPTVISGRTGVVSDDTFAATTEAAEGDHDTEAETGASVWYSWQAPYTGSVLFEAPRSLDSPGSYFDVILTVYTGDSLGSLTSVAQSGDLPFGIVRFDVTEGTTYRLAVSGRRVGDGPPAVGTFRLKWNGPPANDAFADAEALAGTEGTVSGRTSFASHESGEPLHLGTGGTSVWYRWTAPYRGVVSFDTLGSFQLNRQGVGNGGRVYDSVLAAYTGEAVDELSLVAQSNDHAPDQLDSRMTFSVERGQTFYIAVDVNSWDGGGGDFLLNWNEQILPPANDNLAAAEVVEGRNGSADGTLVAATAEHGEPDHGGVGSSVWYSWTASHNGIVTFDAGDAAVVQAYTGSSLAGLEPVVRTGNPAVSSLAFRVTAGTTYLIAVDAADEPHDLTLTWSTPQPPSRA